MIKHFQNELAPDFFFIELAFGSANKKSCSGAHPLNYNIRGRKAKSSRKHVGVKVNKILYGS